MRENILQIDMAQAFYDNYILIKKESEEIDGQMNIYDLN